LQGRLQDCHDPRQLAALQDDMLNLLVLSFGHAEARRRWQTLQ
jgi:hypothetical protein